MVLRILRGEDSDTLSRELGVTAARLSEWRDEFLAARQCVKLQTLARRRRINRGLPPRKEELIRPAIYREVSICN